MMSKSLIGAACAAMILTASSLSAQAATPRQFLENAIRGDNSEIMLGRMAGRHADRSNGNKTVVERGVYSPCNLCSEDPSRPPIWPRVSSCASP